MVASHKMGSETPQRRSNWPPTSAVAKEKRSKSPPSMLEITMSKLERLFISCDSGKSGKEKCLSPSILVRRRNRAGGIGVLCSVNLEECSVVRSEVPQAPRSGHDQYRSFLCSTPPAGRSASSAQLSSENTCPSSSLDLFFDESSPSPSCEH